LYLLFELADRLARFVVPAEYGLDAVSVFFQKKNKQTNINININDQTYELDG